MGSYYSSCQVDTTRTCPSSLQDPMTCDYLGDNGDDLGRQMCWYNTDRVARQIVLPIVLGIAGLISILLLINFYRLRRVRQTKLQLGEIDPNFAIVHGRYAAGANDWTFDRDMLPYLVPDFWRVCCITDPAQIRFMFTLAVALLLLATILLSLGMNTRNHDQRQDSSSDPYGFTAYGWLLIPAVAILCCGQWKYQRRMRLQQLNEAELAMRSVVAPQYAIAVHAIPFSCLIQHQQQQQQQYHPQPYPHFASMQLAQMHPVVAAASQEHEMHPQVEGVVSGEGVMSSEYSQHEVASSSSYEPAGASPAQAVYPNYAPL